MPKDYRHVRKTTIVKKPSGQSIKLGGYRPDKQSSTDKKYRAKPKQDLPPKVDLRRYMTPVENQGESSSCTANAMAGAYEYLASRLMGQSEDVSRLFIYYNARQLDGDTDQDGGSYLRSCVRVLRKYGACSEKTWSFDLERIHEQPHNQAYTEAANFLIEDAYRVDVDLQSMQSCLADGYPFAFGLELFSSFQKAGANGLVPMPDPEDEQHDGGHAMLCVGYSDADQVFIVRNSWGEDWGDRGYCYIPYDYMTKPQYSGDCWAVRQVSASDFSQGIQSGSGSLFSGVKGAIATAFQTPGAAQNSSIISMFEEAYEVEYEEQLVYVEGEGFVSLEDYNDLESLYYQEYEEESEEESEESEESIEEVEETEDSYEESEEEFEEESEESEEEESEEEVEDSYEEECEEEESDEDEEGEEESVDEDSEETEDNYEESEEEESEDEEIEDEDEEIEDSYEDSDAETEESYEEEEDEEADYEE